MFQKVNNTLKFSVQSCLTSWSNMVHVIRTKGPGQLQFWLIALFIGIAAGSAAVLFRIGISELQAFIYGADDITLATAASRLPWYLILFISVIGGLIVGAILHHYTPDGRGRSVAHVIRGVALDNGRVEGKSGLASALASLVTLSMGGSTGREGPVVHLGAVISSKISRMINADGVTGRNLMGCAAAAAVSASFNAPIAGTIFALEVILRHYAIKAFAPIVIASVAGAIVSRLSFGDLTEFDLPTVSLQFYGELPAFLLLGLLCGLVAVVMMRAVFIAEDFGDKVQEKFLIPSWLRPAVAGFGLGAIAIGFPHIIGVGYETTFRALNGNMTFWMAVTLVVIKVVAVALTFAGRMGGGIFSPSLMVGALTGLAFGWVANAIVPSAESYVILYALAGMAAVSAAVLGAPISTTLIVFEFTGDWQTGLAVMVAVSLSSALAGRLIHRSFFLTQLERAGVHIAAGPHEYLLATINVAGLMQDMDDKLDYSPLMSNGHFVDIEATLEGVMPLFESSGSTYLPVIASGIGADKANIVGVLYEVDALRAFNKALVDTSREEHD